MGLARERLDALVSAAIHAPERLPYLWTKIAWVCASDYAFLLHGNPDIDEDFVEPCLTTWWIARSRLPPGGRCGRAVS